MTKNCPKCSYYDNSGIIGGPLHHSLVRMIKRLEQDVDGFNTYVCPQCGYSEFYARMIDEKER